MDTTSALRRWLLLTGLIIGVWTVVGILEATNLYLMFGLLQNMTVSEQVDLNKVVRGSVISWGTMAAHYLIDCTVWAALTFAIFWLGWKFPLDQRRWVRSGLVHLAAGAGMAVLKSALSLAVALPFREDPLGIDLSVSFLLLYFCATFYANYLTYWIIVGLAQALAYYRKYRDRELRASQLETRLAQTQLQVLKMQLHPHFLFNTLHAISALIHKDVELADRMIARLGELLRSTLENVNKQEISLQEELNFIQPYLEIEQARLGPRLTVTVDVDPETRDAAVPNLLLQPLVENAIRHGIAPRAEPGRIEIRAHREQDLLTLQVRDDGPGLANGSAARCKEGIGLANTRARLQQLYGPAHRFELRNGSGRGLEVTVAIPFREADTGSAPSAESAP
jgi:signal transduction histidine kinase